MKNVINCNVCNCVHHDGKCTCTADHIDVGTKDACCCDDTRCATFRMNENMEKNTSF